MLEKILNLINKIKRVFFPFYKDKELKFVFQKLQEGYPKDKIAARFVGGCVRKYLSNDDIDDIDIATTLSSEEIKERFNNTNFRIVDTGIKHGTITLVSKKHKLEITTLRRDVETDGRHAEVEYIDDWKLDSERRDFTINAIYLDINGKIFDPQMGTVDLRNNNIKFIGDPITRIEEDYLRIIRLLRFAFQYDSSNDKTTISAIKQSLIGLAQISKERIFDELMKILKLKNFDNILKHKNKKEIFLKIFPELKNLQRLTKLKKLNNVNFTNNDLLALLITDETDDYEYFNYKYNISKNLKEKLRIMHESFNLMQKDKNIFKGSLKKNIYKYGKQILFFLNIIKFCDRSMMPLNEFLSNSKNIKNCEIPKFKFDGEYLKQLGFPEGPLIGKILKKIENVWVSNNFNISDEEVKRIIKFKN